MTDEELAGGKYGSSGKKEPYNEPDWRPYADIIDRQHHVSKKHPPMSMEERAAQFSPFAALTGYEAAVKETARLTDEREELDEDEKAMINEKLQNLERHLAEHLEASVTYFEPDERKAGGSRKNVRGRIRKIDRDRQAIVFEGGEVISISDILNVEEA